MNATLKVFIAFSPRLNRASPSWDGEPGLAVPVINLMRIVLHRLNIGYARVYPIINPKKGDGG